MNISGRAKQRRTPRRPRTGLISSAPTRWRAPFLPPRSYVRMTTGRGASRCDDLPVDGRLLLLGRELDAFLREVEELGAEEPDPVGAVPTTSRDLARELDVRADLDRRAVGRVRAAPETARSLRDSSRRASESRRSRKSATISSEGSRQTTPSRPSTTTRSPSPTAVEEPVDGDDGRKAERAREDRGVGRLAAALGDEGDDAVARDAHGVRRRELVRDEDDRLAREVAHLEARLLLAAEVAAQDARDVVEVGGAVPQALVREAPEARDEVLRRLRDGPLGVRGFVRDPALDGADEGLVLQEERVRVEDPGVLGAEPLLHVARGLLDLGDGGLRPRGGSARSRRGSPRARACAAATCPRAKPRGRPARRPRRGNRDAGQREGTLHLPIVTTGASYFRLRRTSGPRGRAARRAPAPRRGRRRARGAACPFPPRGAAGRGCSCRPPRRRPS